MKIVTVIACVLAIWAIKSKWDMEQKIQERYEIVSQTVKQRQNWVHILNRIENDDGHARNLDAVALKIWSKEMLPAFNSVFPDESAVDANRNVKPWALFEMRGMMTGLLQTLRIEQEWLEKELDCKPEHY